MWHDVVGIMWVLAGLPDPEDGHGCWDWPQEELKTRPLGPWACCFGDDSG